MSKLRAVKVTYRDGYKHFKSCLVLGEGRDGYLWISDKDNGVMYATIDSRTMDMIARAWIKHRAKP